MNEEKVYIYKLIDPLTHEIRYVGKTINLDKRLKKHKRDALSEGGTKYHRNAWIKSLHFSGYDPIIEVIEEVTLDNWQYWERYYIKKFRDKGYPLTNMADGGEGYITKGKDHPSYGKHRSKETCELIRKKAKERWDNGEYDNIRNKTLEEKWGKEAAKRHHNRMVLYNKNKIVSKETRDKISKNHSKSILLLNDEGDIVYRFPSAVIAAKELGCGNSNVSNCRRFGQKLLKKYNVIYEDDYIKD